MSKAFEKLVREARGEMGKREAESVDWQAVDTKLFARIEREQRQERARFIASPGRRWAGLGVAAAAALFVAVLAGRGREAPSGALAVADARESAGEVMRVEGDGIVLIDGKPATKGAGLHVGDVIDARAGRMTIDRPGKVTYVVEPGTMALVTHVHGGMVLALERGTVEAQVVPVASGEAFAVDVGTSRVAVHGTHLRVERAGERVIVDLNEGVVTVGEAPRVGSLLGALVTAPAHAEFSAHDALDTLTVTHAVSAVRSPMVLEGPPRARADAVTPIEPASPKVEGAGGLHPQLPGTALAVRPEAHPQNGGAQALVPDPNAEATVAAAVRACMAERPRPENVTIEVSTSLHLDLNDDGTVHAARFDPPVAPDVNACAAPSIYRTRFQHPGAATIRIDFQN